ncbi:MULTISPECIES: hypothetical protein [Pseudomonas]|jgi:hypothetical protein|uniref:Lipoprotein n=2 Tax=Pseudomonas TaxID=286 RepID=A0A2C5WDI9_PSEPU|nr:MULTISPECIES: hypothetical protein [Pseudomonas]RBL70181.1 hypothetical protein C3E98_017640 [Pseudomonas sp. MWU13-2625]MBY8957745.1 hypothetical protein [Pseudomonas sp. MIS38]PHH42903.1 hypothetical protein CRX57_22720 [Pseudomonas putida]QBR30724.1 hypothetical protein E3Z29_09285 [Pseudomonas sp. S150]QBX40300.1 hypothetical protein E4T63_06725 [Pseudomonas fluorescens]
MRLKLLFLGLLMLLGGCQATHSLKAPDVDYSQQLPAINVNVLGLPSWMLRDELRRRGTFDEVRAGRSEDGYNVLVVANSDVGALQPQLFLSAFTLFLVPVPVSFDSTVVFSLSHGKEILGVYAVHNHTESWRGAFNASGGQFEHVRLITDTFIAQVLKDQPFHREAMKHAASL